MKQVIQKGIVSIHGIMQYASALPYPSEYAFTKRHNYKNLLSENQAKQIQNAYVLSHFENKIIQSI